MSDLGKALETVAKASSKSARRARDRAALKCWCGNVAGLGQTLCGQHREDGTMTFYATTSVLWAGGEAEYDTSGSSVKELLDRISDQICLDLGGQMPDVVTIHLHKETLDGED